jgi:hypothetical protein
MRGETVEARFRDRTDRNWKHKLLSGWSKIDKSDDLQWASSEGTFWRFCQVYDPPARFLNKPDPGVGWRLLKKYPHEAKADSDEEWDVNERHWKWNPGIAAQTEQQETVWYRRRIDNSPISSDSSRSRDNIPSGWRLLGKDEDRLASDAYWSLGSQDWIIIGDDRVKYANELPRWHAIRQVEHQVDYDLVDGYIYHLPNGQTIRVTAKGFEVGS